MDTITVLELSRLAQVDLNSAYRWLWAGKMEGKKIQGKWKVERVAAERFLEERARRLRGGGGAEAEVGA